MTPSHTVFFGLVAPFVLSAALSTPADAQGGPADPGVDVTSGDTDATVKPIPDAH